MHHRSAPRDSRVPTPRHAPLTHPTPRAARGRRSWTRSLGALGALATTVVLVPATAAVPAHAAIEDCPPDAVLVVVDSTELGGGIEAGCAEAGGTGTDALIAAGFSDTRDASGYVCAIDSLPEPCPTEFTGVYWSYWQGVDGQWRSYEVGSDDSNPEPGAVEGWRYGDGSSGPGTAPDDARPTTDAAAVTAGAGDETPTGLSPAVVAGIGLVAVLLATAALVARRRPGTRRGDGPAARD